MRVIAALLVIALVCQSAMAVTSKSQAKLMMEKINSKLEKSHLGRALKGMVTIATKLGYDYQDLYDAFAALKNQLLNNLDNENSLFETQTASHDSAVAQFNADISNYNGQINDAQAQLNDLNDSLNTYQQNLQDAQQALQDNTDALNAAEEALANAEALYQVATAEYSNADQVIGLAVEKLQEAQSHYDNADLGSFSFVQIKNTFVSFAQKVTEATKGMNAKHQLFVKPVVQAMMQVKNNTSQSSIQTAIKALQDLQAYFQKTFSDLTNEYVSFTQNVQSTIDGLNQIIDILQNQVIPGYEAQISSLQAQIQQVEDALALAQQNLQDAQNALDAENAQWENVVARHQALVDRINSEYDLVTQADRIVRNAQAQVNGSD
ncbi:granule lattice protein (macronuclear) [Tetrahymena thermophila SB210]|uniref:Granule lattice protein n=2 Tax=Tetrahymena thermophila TaxID=5911 RepID=Q23FC8_TETTS|nr:granule lattice protein [Tetrahymena thermophila SB210]AAC27989.1 granule lattice protein 5 precursor [Tetrahymena thermophila]EAR95225.3 granule lattice protein [Tetrahymena thermophila SB210]|eukprot:XP_001015470.3 granule lattice protein [Tetrahymena thermophila SB210]